MSAHIAPIQPEDAAGAAAELLDEAKRKFGRVPEMMKVMANSPALLRSYLTLSAIVAEGALAPAREQLAIANAQRNGCEYCLSAHTLRGRNAAHLSPEELDAARKGESGDPHVAALLRLMREIAATAGDVSPEEVAAARAAGVTDEEIGELVVNVALDTISNYFNVLADVRNDWPVVSL